MRRGVSVVIPVYNGARYLSECIESVRDQTLPATEIIVVDDGSEDDTPKVADDWSDRVRYQRISHGGAARARNHGVRLVETDVVAFIDSDDIWLSSKLELQMATLSRDKDPAMVFGHVQQFVSSDLTSEEAVGLKFNPAPLPEPMPSTLMIRKSESGNPISIAWGPSTNRSRLASSSSGVHARATSASRHWSFQTWSAADAFTATIWAG